MALQESEDTIHTELYMWVPSTPRELCNVVAPDNPL